MVYKNQVMRALIFAVIGAAFALLTETTTSNFYNVYKKGGIPFIIMLIFSLFVLTFVHCAICFVVLAGSVLLNSTKLIHKNPRTGMLSVPSFIFWAPYILFQYIGIFFTRCILKKKLPVISEITPNFYLGGLPDMPGFDPRVLSVMDAVVDMTCDLPEGGLFRSYLLVPVWDGLAPTAAQIKEAADWIYHERQANHTVFVHCCYGVGRSATVMAAALVKCGVCQTLDDACKLIRSQRPFVEIGQAHMTELGKWMEMERRESSSIAYFY